VSEADWVSFCGYPFTAAREAAEVFAMKRVIGGLVFSTGAAELVWSWTNGCGAGDLDWLCEALYRTSRGRWFLEVSGGARTRAARRTGDGYVGGSVLEPLSDREALEWLERKAADVDVVRRFFPLEDA